MKANKITLIAALALGGLLTLNPSRAQDSTNTPTPPAGQRPPGMRGAPSLDQIAARLDLTDDQKAKVKPVLEAQMQKMRDLRSDTSLSQDDRRAKRMALQAETAAQLKTILTAEQFDKWQKMIQRNRRPGGPAGGNPGNTAAPAAPPQN